ncbi:hypothetical protein [Rhodophyticola porphyridii]|uniref:hypothetical protein n=1 Tax=Rhodophyticola porphyridii TaxID=1852017 RepID=UPI0035D10CFE
MEWKIEEKYRQKRARTRTPCRWSSSVRNAVISPTGWVDIQREEFKRLGVTGKWENALSDDGFP